jgi:hypothetical protein
VSFSSTILCKISFVDEKELFCMHRFGLSLIYSGSSNPVTDHIFWNHKKSSSQLCYLAELHNYLGSGISNITDPWVYAAKAKVKFNDLDQPSYHRAMNGDNTVTRSSSELLRVSA